MKLPLFNAHPSGELFSGVTPPAFSIFSHSIPKETVTALGAIGDDLLAQKRGSYFEVEGDGASECERFVRAIERFAQAAKRLPCIPDLQLYTQVDEIIAQAGTTVRTIHSFASQFCDPRDTTSKYLLMKAIEHLVGELYATCGELTVKEEAVVRVRSEAKVLEPPELSFSDRAEVLKRSRSAATSVERPSEDLILSHGPHYSVASVVRHSPHFNPHDHLLVKSNYVVSSGGLLQRIPLHAASSTHGQGLSVTLGFAGCITAPLLSQLPGYAITKISYHNKTGSEVQTREGEQVFLEAKPRCSRSVVTTIVTYQQVTGREKNPTPRSRLERAELCTPEIFLKLYKKFREESFSAPEKAQLVAQAFFSQHLVYERGPQVEQLLSACNPQHKLSFILGLGMGDCKLLSAVLQQLLVHAGLSAVIEGGAVCSADGTSYENPGHARVKVYCQQRAIRLDPTLWTKTDTRISPIKPDSLERLLEQLQGADAEQSYKLGREARRLMTSRRDRGEVRDWRSHDRQNGQYPPSHSPGHRLSDDFDKTSQSELYKLCATSDPERSIGSVWSMYQECIDDGWNPDLFLNHHTARILCDEIDAVGPQQSKLCSLIPQMVQTIAEKTEIFPETIIEFIGYFPASLRSILFSRMLSESTADSCAHALSAYCGLKPSEDSAHFLVRLINLLYERSLSKKTIFDSTATFFYQKIACLAETFPAPQREAIGEALSLFYGETRHTARDMLIDYHAGCGLYTADGFPRRIMSSLFPELLHSPVTFAEKLFAKYAEESGDRGVMLSFDDKLVALYTLSGYFDSSVCPLIKPIVTGYLREFFELSAAKAVDYRASVAVAELCDVVWEEDQQMAQKPLAFNGGPDGYDPVHCLVGSFIEWTGDLDPNSPQLLFVRGYLLKQLHSKDLLDIEALAPYLCTPTNDEVRLAWDSLFIHKRFIQDDLDDLPPPRFFFQDESYASKAVELYLAVLACSHSPPDAISGLLKLAANEPTMISPGTLELVKIIFRRAPLQLTPGRRQVASIAVPEAMARRFSTLDKLQLRSFVRVRAACMLLEMEGSDSRNKLLGQNRDTSNDLHVLAEEVVRGAWASHLNFRAVPPGRMETTHRNMLPAYTETALPQFILSIQEPPIDSWPPIPDGEESLRALGRRVSQTHKDLHFLYRDTSIADHERARAVVLALIGETEAHLSPTIAPQLSATASPNLWRDQVAASLRLQRADGPSRLLRRITQHRTENFSALRPYVPGEDLRLVDWRASARNPNGLTSRTYQKEAQPLADSIHVVMDLADLINEPTFRTLTWNQFEFGMATLAPNRATLMKLGYFLQSLLQERRSVTFSVYALGARVLHSDLSAPNTERTNNRGPLDSLLTALSSLAESYADFCNISQCVPHCYSIAGLMTAAERQQFQQNLAKSVLVLYLETRAGARFKLDPVFEQLVFTGQAARVNIELP